MYTTTILMCVRTTISCPQKKNVIMYIAMKRVSQLINNVSPIVHSSMVQCISLRQINFNTYIEIYIKKTITKKKFTETIINII